MLIVEFKILRSNPLASWHHRKLSPLLGELGKLIICRYLHIYRLDKLFINLDFALFVGFYLEFGK